MKRETTPLFQPGSCPSKPEAIRRVARKVSSIDRKLQEAARWCEHHGLDVQAVQLMAMSMRAANISHRIHVAADRARAPGSPGTRVRKP